MEQDRPVKVYIGANTQGQMFLRYIDQCAGVVLNVIECKDPKSPKYQYFACRLNSHKHSDFKDWIYEF